MSNGTAGFSRGKVFGVVVLVLLALLFGYLFYKRSHEAPTTTFENTVLNPPVDLPQFNLTDCNGNAFTRDSLQNQWTLLFFGYTNCMHLCPTTMSTLNQMYQILVTQQQSPMPQVVMISIDPEHDSLTKLKQFVTSFNPHFQGATGQRDEIDVLTKALNIEYAKQNSSENPNGYTIDHSGAVALVDPSGRLIMIFSPPIDPKVMAHDINLITSSSG